MIFPDFLQHPDKVDWSRLTTVDRVVICFTVAALMALLLGGLAVLVIVLRRAWRVKLPEGIENMSHDDIHELIRANDVDGDIWRKRQKRTLWGVGGFAVLSVVLSVMHIQTWHIFLVMEWVFVFASWFVGHRMLRPIRQNIAMLDFIIERNIAELKRITEESQI